MRYIILYRDGGIGRWLDWEEMLNQVEHVLRNFPYPFHPVGVVTEEQYWEAIARLGLNKPKGDQERR